MVGPASSGGAASVPGAGTAAGASVTLRRRARGAGGLLLGGVTASRRTQRLRRRGVGRHVHAEQGGDLGQQRPEALHRGSQLVGAGFRCGGRDHQRGGLAQNATASSTADQRSGPSVGCNEAVVASARRVASEPGNGTPAFGGCDDSRKARTTRPTSRAASTSASHRASSSSCFVHQRRLERGGERTRGLVAGDQRVVGRRHHAAQVAEVEVLELALRGLGVVQPVGDA